MAQWVQIGGDIDAKEYGAVLARVEGSSVEVVEIEPDEEHEGWYYIITADFDKDDLDWKKGKYAPDIAKTMGASRDDWEEWDLAERGEAALRYHGSNWSQGGPEHVKGWKNALNSAVGGSSYVNSIKWWSR